jgi:histone-lysine N-methyltransferase SETMAR
MEWKHPSSPVHKKFKQQPSCKKLMLTFFWHMRGPILVKFQAHGETVNSAKYSALLQDQLKPAIHHKGWGLLSKWVLLFHGNARPHTATATVQTVQRLGFELLPHPLYSSDLTPSDYHIFGPLKETLCGHRFGSHGDVQQAVQTRFCEEPKSFFFEGMKKLTERYQKCIIVQGDYVKK